MKTLCDICQKLTETKVIGGNTICSQEVTETEWEQGKLFSDPTFIFPQHEYEVFDLETDESHGAYPTLEQARGCVRFDKLKAYAIWRGNLRVECCEPYDGDDDRVKQMRGEPNASETEN